jgi:hypothetical protein
MVFYTFRSLEFATIFALAPSLVNDTTVLFSSCVHTLTGIAILIFIGCLAKSANLPFHVWLPSAMQGFKGLILSSLGLFSPVGAEKPQRGHKSWQSKLLICETRAPLRGAQSRDSAAVTCRKTHPLPFSPASSGPSGAAKGGKNYLQKRYFSTRDTLPPIIYTVPRKHLETITGNMLGDGSIRPGSVTRDGVVTGNARYGMTMMASSKDYLIFLRENIFLSSCVERRKYGCFKPSRL